jgi:hypothetical protein
MSSEGGGWNGDAAAGCPAVVGVVGGDGVGVGLRAGGGRVAVRAGAAGAARRAGRGFGASTVTCGTGTVGAAPVGGVSGCVGCCGCGVSAGGVCGVVGGVSGAGVCDDTPPAKQSSMSAELLSRSKRLFRIDMTPPPNPPNINTFRAETTLRAGPAAASLARAWPVPARCQAIGGARARKRAVWDAAKSNSTAAASRKWPNTLGSGKAGVSAGTNAPARWISVQIGQQSSATSSRPGGLDGALTSSPDCVLANAAAPADRGASSSRCTWPNETASWNASANSARYDPNLERDRNQRIVVSFASRTEQTHSAGDRWRL